MVCMPVKPARVLMQEDAGLHYTATLYLNNSKPTNQTKISNPNQNNKKNITR